MNDKFTSLPIFKASHELVIEVYRATKDFPAEERYGLTSQIRRSVSSVPTNIVEGNARGHKKEFVEFLYIAKGSLEETKYHLLLAKDLGFVETKKYDDLHEKTQEIGRQLSGLIKYWRQKV